MNIVFRPNRWRRALAAGSIVTLWATFIVPTIGMAGTVLTYKDKFFNISFSGSDGTASWAGPWIEIGESDGPSNGAVQVRNDSHCASGNCLQIGAEDPDDAGATRTFDSNGASSVVLTFDYVRHVTSSGSGSGGAGVLKVLASANGTSWNLIDTFPMNVDDSAPNAANYDLTSFSGSASAIKFELFGGTDDGHISIDNVVITVTGGSGPTTTSTSSTTTSSVPTTTAAPSTTSTTTTPTTTTSMSATTTTTTPAPSSTTTTSSPRITTTTVPVITTNPRTTSTTAPVSTTVPRPTGTTSTSASTTTSTTAAGTTTTEAGALPPSPDEPPAAFTPAEAREAKENLVVELPAIELSGGQARPDYRLDPREGLSVSFATAVETLQGNFLNSVLLGVTISILLLLGIDRRDDRSSFRASHS